MSVATDIFDDETWAAVNAFYDEHGLLRHQTGAFNVFLTQSILSIIDAYRKNTYSSAKGAYTIELGNHFLESPQNVEAGGTKVSPQYPMQCLHRNITYASKLHIDIKVIPPAGEPQHHTNVFIGLIPIMTRSDMCNLKQLENDPQLLCDVDEDPYDEGGYFIVGSKGKDGTAHKRVIIPQERAIPNEIFVFSERKAKPKYPVYSEIRSQTSNGLRTTTCTMGYMNGIISVVLPWYESTEISLGIIFRALGVKDEYEMISLIYGKEWANIDNIEDEKLILQRTFENSYEFETQEDCLVYIGRKSQKSQNATRNDDNEDEDVDDLDFVDEQSYARKLISEDLFLHIENRPGSTIEDAMNTRAHFLGVMAFELLSVISKKKQLSDRDHLQLKRVMDVNVLLTQQLASAFRKIFTEVKKVCTTALESGTGANVIAVMKPSIITNSLSGALSNNNWSRGTATGVSQILEEFNMAGGLANKRKVTVPIAAEASKNVEQRDLHGSHFNAVCPSETPEGKKVGLLKNMAMISLITLGNDPSPIFIILFSSGLISKLSREYSQKDYKVFLNGDLIGTTTHGMELFHYVRNKRRSGNISREISVTVCTNLNEPLRNVQKCVRIFTDQGRFCYPAFIIENNRMKFGVEQVQKLVDKEMSWTDLCNNGYVELIDKNEEDMILLASIPSEIGLKIGMVGVVQEKFIQHTHCELHPSLIYGIGGSLIPYPDHNQSPRNCYQASMGKQAIGYPFYNYRQMPAGKFHTMGYVQKPLALSRAGHIIRYDELPAGQNAVVCVMPRYYNEEDSIEISQSAADRGFMVSYLWTVYYTQATNHEVFARPSDAKLLTSSAYSKLDHDGVVPPGTKITKGDVLICKLVIDPLTKKETVYTTTFSHVVDAIVDKVQIGVTGEGYPYVRVMVCQKRTPAIGDKFCVLPETEVLTLDGWKYITDIDLMNDKVAQLNTDTHHVEYVSPVGKYVFPHEGEMYHVSNNKLEMITTMNHKMYVSMENSNRMHIYDPHSWKLIEASQVYGKNATYKTMNGAVKVNSETDETIIYYSGKIYCIEVPSHVFYARMNGKEMWTGNSARHGQKGTVGFLWNQADLPFSADGISPDLILNSLAFPSRMTIAMLIELLVGRVVTSPDLEKYTIDDLSKALDSTLHFEDVDVDNHKEKVHDMFFASDGTADATPFRKFDLSLLRKEIKRLGIPDLCDEIMYDGITGKAYKSLIFKGPVFYQRLKHMTFEKVHARSRGGKTTITRQPREGRGQGGGLRCGVQERDCILASGGAKFARDRLFEQSDSFYMWVCDICGLNAIVNEQTGHKECKVCATNKVSKIGIPYGTKLVHQELMGMNIVPRYITN